MKFCNFSEICCLQFELHFADVEEREDGVYRPLTLLKIQVTQQQPRLESLPCAADFSAAHFKFQPRFQPRNFRKTTKGNNRAIVY